VSALAPEDVVELARLARLELEPDEAAALGRELGEILAHMATLAEVDTTGVEPMTHAIPLDLALRADEVESSLPVEAALGQAPDRDGDAFRVPAAIPRDKGER
jgi:aspartyl-tRNA(Asn)/glutamyl-tRNA(Gln) amidotransferase subunit C